MDTQQEGEGAQTPAQHQLSAALSEFEFALSQLESYVRRVPKAGQLDAGLMQQKKALEVENEALKAKQALIQSRLDQAIGRVERLMKTHQDADGGQDMDIKQAEGA